MADGRHVGKYGNAITRQLIDRFGQNLGPHIPPCHRHVRHDAVTTATAVA